MKKIIILVVVSSLILLTSCRFGSWRGVKGNGELAKEERDIDNFEKLNVGGSFNVEIKVGEETSLRIETDENLMKYIVTRVKGNTLHIDSKKNLKPKEGLNIYITTNKLTEIDCSGAASVEAYDVYSNRFKVDVSGAADVNLEGNVESLDADISGAASLDAEDLIAKNVSVDASGASNASVYASVGVRAEASGASSVNCYGDPKNGVRSDVSGAGSIKRK